MIAHSKGFIHCLILISESIIGNRGFSIGIGDVTPGKQLINEKEQLLRNG